MGRRQRTWLGSLFTRLLKEKMTTPNSNKSQKQEELEALVQSAYDAIKKAQELADEHSLSFRFGVADQELAGTYHGKKFDPESDLAEEWELASQEDWDAVRDNGESFVAGWYSSYFSR